MMFTHLVLCVLMFTLCFPLNVLHLKRRNIPLYSVASFLAAVHLLFFLWSFLAIPIVSILVALGVEVYLLFLNDRERQGLQQRYEAEQERADRQVEQAQSSYEALHCLATYTVEMEWQYRADLKRLEQNAIGYFVRNGLITSILVRPEDRERAMVVMGLSSEEA